MSAIAVNPLDRAVRFYDAPIGKKAVMAVTGVMLVGYVVAHLLGNLQIYSSNHEQINGYAAFLHNPNTLRPSLIRRMPRFNLSDSDNTAPWSGAAPS